MTAADDPDDLRARLRESWESVAPNWDAKMDPFYAAAEPLSAWMIEQAAPAPGQRILEVAAGRGDLGLALAPLVQPGGSVVCTDGAEAMVAVIERRAAEAGVELEARTMELEWLDAPAASVDAIVSRFGYMLCVDPLAALQEARRVLRPQGRLVIVVWDRPEHNLLLSAAVLEGIAAGHLPPPVPGEPGPFALSDRDRLTGLLHDAGFLDVRLTDLPIELRMPSLDALWDMTLDASERLRGILAGLSPAEHYRFRDAVEARWAPYAATDGAVALPGLAIGVVADA